jgi:hypothetical protein
MHRLLEYARSIKNAADRGVPEAGNTRALRRHRTVLLIRLAAIRPRNG